MAIQPFERVEDPVPSHERNVRARCTSTRPAELVGPEDGNDSLKTRGLPGADDLRTVGEGPTLKASKLIRSGCHQIRSADSGETGHGTEEAIPFAGSDSETCMFALSLPSPESPDVAAR